MGWPLTSRSSTSASSTKRRAIRTTRAGLARSINWWRCSTRSSTERRVFTKEEAEMEQHEIVSQNEWIEARKALLAEERAFTHARDALVAKRQALPWVKVEKTYTFETPQGPRTLAQLFGPRSQLLVYHFMLGPEWEEGCPGCSFLSDHVD